LIQTKAAQFGGNVEKVDIKKAKKELIQPSTRKKEKKVEKITRLMVETMLVGAKKM
jgi:hypothetical protein